MNLKQNVPKPASAYSTMLSVDRALHEFRRGRIVRIDPVSSSVLGISPEMVSDQIITMLLINHFYYLK